MYQQPAQQIGAQTAFPSQQPAAGSPQGYGPPAQPIMYQMTPGQPQPVSTGQPPMGQQGQPLQYYVPAGQPGQHVPIQGAPAQPPLNQEEEVTSIKIDITYLKGGLNFSRMSEFVSTAVRFQGGRFIMGGFSVFGTCFDVSNIIISHYEYIVEIYKSVRYKKTTNIQ